MQYTTQAHATRVCRKTVLQVATRLSNERRQTTIDRLDDSTKIARLLTYLLTYLQGCIVGKVGAETSRSVRETGRSTGSRLLHTSNSHQKSTVVLPRVPATYNKVTLSWVMLNERSIINTVKRFDLAVCRSGNAAVTTTIRLRFDGRLTVYQRSLISQ